MDNATYIYRELSAEISTAISTSLGQIQTFRLGLVHRDSHDGIVAARNLGAKEARRGAELGAISHGDEKHGDL